MKHRLTKEEMMRQYIKETGRQPKKEQAESLEE